MMTHANETKAGYIRAQAALKLLDRSVAVGFEDPKIGYLDLMTEDGRLRLSISQSIAADLIIDLQQFLTIKPSSSNSTSRTMK